MQEYPQGGDLRSLPSIEEKDGIFLHILRLQELEERGREQALRGH